LGIVKPNVVFFVSSSPPHIKEQEKLTIREKP
jgi:hypothetical protein